MEGPVEGPVEGPGGGSLNLAIAVSQGWKEYGWSLVGGCPWYGRNSWGWVGTGT